MKNIQRYIVSVDGILEDAIKCIELNHSRCAIIVDKKMKVYGVISDGDILRSILNGKNIYSPIKNNININFKFLKKKDNEEALKIIKKFCISLIPVVNQELILKDIITLEEILTDI